MNCYFLNLGAQERSHTISFDAHSTSMDTHDGSLSNGVAAHICRKVRATSRPPKMALTAWTLFTIFSVHLAADMKTSGSLGDGQGVALSTFPPLSHSMVF